MLLTSLEIELLAWDRQLMVLADASLRRRVALVRQAPPRERIAAALIGLARRIAPAAREPRVGMGLARS